MKKLLLLSMMLLLPMVASADPVEIDGIWYNLDATNQTAEVTYNEGNDYSADVTIPPSVTYNNTPYSVTSIGESAFKGCSTLETISLPSTILLIGVAAFRDCSGLDNISIPSSVKSIGNGAFSGCSGFTSIEIPNGVTSIGGWAFHNCSSLSNIIVPNSVTNIGACAFDGTSWDNSQPDGMVYIGYFAYKYKGEMPANTNIILNDGTIGIVGGAFKGYPNLVGVSIPDGVIFIGESAFNPCI